MESNLKKVLEKGEFAVTVELGPPKDSRRGIIERKGELLKDYADAINVTDNQTAIVRMSSIAACAILKQMGIEPVMQMVCRDRNRIAMQSDIFGAYALGVKNILCLSGDHQKFGNHPTSKGVFDIDSTQLIQMVKKMRDEGEVLEGDKIKEPPHLLFIGAAANPFADPFEFRSIRLAKKIRAGANFIQTQAVFNVEKFKEWMKMVRDKGLDKKVHILAGIIPIKSARMAAYMKEEVAGLNVPQEIVDRMKGAADAKKEGMRISLEIIEQMKSIKGVHGIHIMAVGWEKIVPSIVDDAGLFPRPKFT